MWSNLVDRAWLYGGRSEADIKLQNSLWRFERASFGNQWTSLPVGLNMSRRPTNGAGCNVPDLQTGYYLGGVTYSDDEGSSDLHFHHKLAVFDMKTETLSSFDLPDFVPVVNQSLVFLNTGNKKGALVALGGFIEKNGNLSIVGRFLPFPGCHS
jgi:hypothetical protein